MADERVKAPEQAGRLLKVVEVAYEARIKCRAAGCGRPVFRRIHVVDLGDEVTVVGSDCFEKLYGHSHPEEALFGGSAGDGDASARLLSADERELLETNTEAFIALMRSEYEQTVERELVELEAQLEAQKRADEAASERMEEWERRQQQQRHADMAAEEERQRQEQAKAALERAIDLFDPAQRATIESNVRDEMVARYQINVSLPGWSGWYRSIVRSRIIGALGKSGNAQHAGQAKPEGHALAGRMRRAWDAANQEGLEPDAVDEGGTGRDEEQGSLW